MCKTLGREIRFMSFGIVSVTGVHLRSWSIKHHCCFHGSSQFHLLHFTLYMSCKTRTATACLRYAYICLQPVWRVQSELFHVYSSFFFFGTRSGAEKKKTFIFRAKLYACDSNIPQVTWIFHEITCFMNIQRGFHHVSRTEVVYETEEPQCAARIQRDCQNMRMFHFPWNRLSEAWSAQTTLYWAAATQPPDRWATPVFLMLS